MNASNFFKILVRSLMIVFIVTFFMNISQSSQSKDDIKDLTRKLHIENSDNALSTWLSLDQTNAKTHLVASMKHFEQSNPEKFKEEIKIAKILIADEKQSPLYLEINKAEKAFENVALLKKTFDDIPKLTQKFVRLVSNNPMIVGHVIDEKNGTVSIRDQDGFIIPIHKKNIVSMNEIDGFEKEKIYRELLAKIMEDNGKTSSYGLYLSAKWAHENNLEEKVNSILFQAAMSDSQIIMTIADNEARKILSVARWSNLIGDYEIAKVKAQQVVKEYSHTSQLKEAEETLQDILNNIEKEKKILARLKDKKPVEKLTASVEQKEDFVTAPVLKEAKPEPIAEPVVEVAAPKNTLKLKSQKNEEINQEAVNNKPELPEEIVEEVKNDKKSPIKNALYQDSTYQEALELVNEGKAYMKKANAFDNPGNKNAQVNYRLALKKFETAVSKLNKLSKKFGEDEEFQELSQQASGMHFFITKSCLRLKF